jgi:hypothetical protein
MNALKQGLLSYRSQALITLTVVVLWYWDVRICRRSGERAPAIAMILFFALPILTAVLSFVVLDSRIRDRQRSDWWFYVALLSGLVPLFSMFI